jgi:two-component system, LuxR family, sensor kinase FixL
MQVFLNLIRNSEAAMEAQTTGRMRITASVGAQQVFVRLIDTGSGVEHPEYLFKPFQQKSKHIGLGLYLSRALMRSFRGDLRYEPANDGTVFVIELARAAEAPNEFYRAED